MTERQEVLWVSYPSRQALPESPLHLARGMWEGGRDLTATGTDLRDPYVPYICLAWNKWIDDPTWKGQGGDIAPYVELLFDPDDDPPASRPNVVRIEIDSEALTVDRRAAYRAALLLAEHAGGQISRDGRRWLSTLEFTAAVAPIVDLSFAEAAKRSLAEAIARPPAPPDPPLQIEGSPEPIPLTYVYATCPNRAGLPQSPLVLARHIWDRADAFTFWQAGWDHPAEAVDLHDQRYTGFGIEWRAAADDPRWEGVERADLRVDMSFGLDDAGEPTGIVTFEMEEHPLPIVLRANYRAALLIAELSGGEVAIGEDPWSPPADFAREHRDLIEAPFAEVAEASLAEARVRTDTT